MDAMSDSDGPQGHACLVAEHGGARFALHPPTPFALTLGPGDTKLLIAFGAGAIDLRFDDGPTLRRSLRPDELVLAAAGATLSARHVAPLEFLVVSLAPDRVRGVAERAGLRPDGTLADTHAWRDPSVAALGAEMRRGLIAEGLPQAAYLGLLADALVAGLMLHTAQRRPNPPPDALAPATLARVIAHMEAHLDRGLTVAELAGVAGLSEGHFARAFARTTGDPPLRFLMKRRVCRARDLLSGTPLSIAEIAARAGFASQAHLSTSFARQVGLPPARYRASFRPSGREVGPQAEP